jgi:hypothetical protein
MTARKTLSDARRQLRTEDDLFREGLRAKCGTRSITRTMAWKAF